MLYKGRQIDVLALWQEFVDFPPRTDPSDTFLPLVFCPNPDHDNSRSPAFQINTRQPTVHCFARCGIQGTYEHALCMILGIYNKRGVTREQVKLARICRVPREPAHIADARAKVAAAHKEARQFILKQSQAAIKIEVPAFAGEGTRKSITADDEVAKDERQLEGGAFSFLPKEARAFLDKREIDGPSRGKWRIGWDEDRERLVIPAYDERGNLRFLIRQRIDGVQRAKYLYTSGSIKTSLLFGHCFLDREALRSRGLILCEGPLDAIRLHQLGMAFAVAILGSGLSKRQVQLIDKIQPPRVYLFYDKDNAGAANVADAKEKVRKVPVFVCRYPKGKSDPAELTGKEVERSIERALTIHEFSRKARQLVKTL